MSDTALTVQDPTNQYDIENDKEVSIEAGQYWLRKKTEPLNADIKQTGTDLKLIQSLNIIDNILHSVELAPHPLSHYSKPTRMMTDIFLDGYDFVPLEIAEQMRAEEIDEVNQELNELRDEMMIGYVDEGGISATKLLQNASNQKGSVDNLPVTASRDIKQIKESAKALTEVAKNQANFIKGKNELITKATKKLAHLYQEKSTQALASVDGTMKFVQKLNIGVETLDIFTGKGIGVHKVSEGEPASIDEPLSFYQRKLYFDEEVFVSYMDGGADINNVGSFGKYLAEDKELLNRFIPSQRGAVLFQVRRKSKSYLSNDTLSVTMGDLFYQAQMDKLNEACFLLLRNGENVYLIESEFLDGGSRLFPTSKEIGTLYSKFQGIDEKIKPSDLEYVDSRDKHQNKTTYYKRILVLLSGLYTRDEKVLGVFKDSDKYVGAWYNIDFQRDCCEFIYDDENALDFNAQSFTDYLEDKNRYLRGGSRIVFIPHKLINSSSAPLMFKSEWNNYKRVNEHEQKAIVKRDKNEFIIEQEVHKDLWNPTDGDRDSYKKCKINLSEASSGDAYLVLDAVTSSELKAFITSRKQREYYLAYMELFLEAYQTLKKEEEEIQPFIDELKSNIQVDSSVDLQPIIEEAVRIYRADNEGAMLPVPHKDNEKHYLENKELRESYMQALDGVGQIIFSILKEDSLLGRIKEASEGIDVVRIVVDAKGKYFIYADVPEDKQYAFLQDSVLSYPMIYKYPVKLLKTKVSIGEAKEVYDTKISIEKILFETRVSYASSESEYTVLNKEDNAVNVRNYIVDEKFLKTIDNLKISFEFSKNILDEAFSEDGLKRESIDILLDEHIQRNKNKAYHEKTRLIFPLAVYGFNKANNPLIMTGSHNYAYIRKSIGVTYIYTDVDGFVGMFAKGENREYAKEKLSRHRLNKWFGKEYKYIDSNKPEKSCMRFFVGEIGSEKQEELVFKNRSGLCLGYIRSQHFSINNGDSNVESMTYKEEYDKYLAKNDNLTIQVLDEVENIEKYYDILRDDKIKEYYPRNFTSAEVYNSLSKNENKLKFLYEVFSKSIFTRAHFEKTEDDEVIKNYIERVKKTESGYVLEFNKREAVGFVPEKLTFIR